MTLAGLAGVQAEEMPLGPRLRWPQEGVVTAFAKLYPPDWVEGFAFHCIKDLLNTPTFTEYPERRKVRELPTDGPRVPAEVKGRGIMVGRHAAGQQQGAVAHEAELPPTVSHGLSEDEHFEEAQRAAASALPLEAPPVRTTTCTTQPRPCGNRGGRRRRRVPETWKRSRSSRSDGS